MRIGCGAGSHLAAVEVLADVLDGIDAAAEEHDRCVDPPLVRDEGDELAHLRRVPVVRDRRGAQHEQPVILRERGVGELALERLEDLIPLRTRILGHTLARDVVKRYQATGRHLVRVRVRVGC